MTKGTEQQLKAFIKDALEFRSLLNSVPYDSDLTPEDREELLALKPFSDLCVGFAYTLRRVIWKEWDRQRQEEQKRKRAAQKRRQQRHRERKSTKTR